ncbi:AsnC family transcriptional regulator [Shewanella colwelliana]|uniref:AsnC family transcriptional regulator n=1 Tax=Shewanella colwelliana TaxID=23 RepID=A0A1E5IW15_SHECO|nr:Lrp/AsnC family transcriptional regulator [Shewanella colwelliana]MDX1283124.1 Lrp/AsnC family transcriptional regulator [Shewanella colwelliana]OEG74761.1 AsnC family transcriptional regulator [Shewanella colwelliana]GIU26980.1 AsnC family transcriptional regulator [Shewanella colwelliana]
MTLQLDDIDLKILALLQQHGRLANQELASLVGLSASPCSRRVKALEEAGFIAGYATLLNPKHFDLQLTAYIQVRLEKHSQAILDAFELAMSSYDEVLECCLLTGSDADYQLKVLVCDMEAFKRFLLEKLTTQQDIAGIRSSFVLKQVKNQTAIPLPKS